MRSAGQELALAQVRAIAAASNGGTRLVQITEPTESNPRLVLDVSFDCSHIPESPGGIHLHGRERLLLKVPAGFPYERPSVYSTHRRWAGTPHVQWGRYLCLYQATSEWDARQGMYGLAKRIDLWLMRAAAAELDPADAPLHPPAVYSGSSTRIVVNANAPPVTDKPWLGYARLEKRSDRRVDVNGWSHERPDGEAAFAILLSEPFAWEYPETISRLYEALAKQDIPRELLDALLIATARIADLEQPMYVVLGTPMRRGHDGHPRQHIAVWEIAADLADGLRLALPRHDDKEDIAETRHKLRKALAKLMPKTDLEWCSVSENRPEIIIRRDDQSPIHEVFAGKKVVVWGCGAIGAHVAQWIARGGARQLVLHDYGIVTPGILVRQPFDEDDIGRAKARVLANQLLLITPSIDVDVEYADVIRGAMARPDWHADADILIDATASAAVRLKLEEVRRLHPPETTTVVSLLFGHECGRGVAAIAPPQHTGGTEDVLRQIGSACWSDRDGLGAFADEFWPDEPRTDHFQPEPGCSDTTFRGSATEVAALTGTMLHAVCSALVSSPEQAAGHLVALPAVEHAGRRTASIEVPSAHVLDDGVGPYEIRLSLSALAEIRGWIAHNDRAGNRHAETGGVLFGRRDEATSIVWIDTAIGPPPDSVGSPERFDCGVAGVPEAIAEQSARTGGDREYLGMWHTHPDSPAHASFTDLQGMLGLVASQEAREAVMLIVSTEGGDEALSGYVFNGDAFRDGPTFTTITINNQPTAPAPRPPAPTRHVGLALSGGGSRALAFHLGCLRALHDRGVLPSVRVVSGVSGGALMTALYAYGPADFDEFDDRVVGLLRRGLQWRAARRALTSRRVFEDVGTRLVAGVPSAAAAAASKLPRVDLSSDLRRWSSRTDAFTDVLRRVLGDVALDGSRREDGLDAVINACDLRSGSAFRFGSQSTTSSRYGRLVEPVDLATAVAASAAYPLLLPALDRRWTFEGRDGAAAEHRVVLTDGGVYDNSGTSCLRPGRSAEHTGNVFSVDYVIACDAGRGQLGEKVPFHMAPRVGRAFEASFRKLQDASRGALHERNLHGELAGFVMPYLGQQDHRLPWAPPDLVPRAAVADYPTNFKAMSKDDLKSLTTRGEQLTRLLVERWCPEL